MPRSSRAFDWDVSLRQLNPPANTIDALMDRVDTSLHILDLKHVPAERLASADSMLAFDQTVPIDDFSQAFDALIHVRQVSLVQQAFELLRDDIAAASRSAPS